MPAVRNLFFCTLSVFALVGCAEPPITPQAGDLPLPRGFSPSVGEEAEAQQNGVRLTSEQARQRVDEFRITPDSDLEQWPVDSITYKGFNNTSQRAIYLRRALGRYALIQAQERGTGTSLSKVRKTARTSAPSTRGEWWAVGIHKNDLQSDHNRSVALPDAIYSAVRNSHQIAAFGDLPAIRGTAIQEAKGRFVPEFFAELKNSRENSRATSPGIAAGAARSITTENEAEFGIRSRLTSGGEISVSQRFTTTDTNRTSYIPGEQTEAQTTISLVQPLLRGSGFDHNDAPRRIANMDTQIAVEEFRRQSESHLMEIERAYWNLYVARAVYIQKNHLADHGTRLAGQVANRIEIDADPILVSRARSLASQWKADAVRAKAAMDNAEFRFASLINDPKYGPTGVELVPASSPNGALSILGIEDTIEEIFVNRAELQQAILQYEAALLREGVAANQSLPELDLVLEATAIGGADGANPSRAFADKNNGFGHTVGLKFSVPLGFDERDARYKRRRIETIQQERQVLSVISTVLAEVDVSANEYIVATQDLVAQRQAQQAAQRDLDTMRNRWNDGIGDQEGIAILSALLSSYQQVQTTEQAVATARATREIAAANLARARGVLLERWGLKTDVRSDVRDQPTYKLVRNK